MLQRREQQLDEDAEMGRKAAVAVEGTHLVLFCEFVQPTPIQFCCFACTCAVSADEEGELDCDDAAAGAEERKRLKRDKAAADAAQHRAAAEEAKGTKADVAEASPPPGRGKARSAKRKAC